MPARALLLLICCAVLGACVDPRRLEGCRPEACTALLSCGQELMSTSAFSRCLGNLPGRPEGDALTRYFEETCVAACQRSVTESGSNIGLVLACVQEDASECALRDGESPADRQQRRTAVVTTCQAEQRTFVSTSREAECTGACDGTYDRCGRDCPTTAADFPACHDCAQACVDAWFACTRACPFGED